MSLDPATLAALRGGYVPGACLPGLLQGWIGPAEFSRDPTTAPWSGCARMPLPIVENVCAPSVAENTTITAWRADPFKERGGHAAVLCGVSCTLSAENFRLPLARPEVRLRVAALMAAGEPCHICLRHKFPEAPACATCRGSGYLRKPAPLWHLLPAAEVGPGGLPPELAQYAPDLVACSVARGLAGLAPVADISVWRRENCGWVTRDGRLLTVDFLSLRDGYALLDTTVLRAPWPEVA